MMAHMFRLEYSPDDSYPAKGRIGLFEGSWRVLRLPNTDREIMMSVHGDLLLVKDTVYFPTSFSDMAGDPADQIYAGPIVSGEIEIPGYGNVLYERE
jgi:hypothetical protein